MICNKQDKETEKDIEKDVEREIENEIGVGGIPAGTLPGGEYPPLDEKFYPEPPVIHKKLVGPVENDYLVYDVEVANDPQNVASTPNGTSSSREKPLSKGWIALLFIVSAKERR